MAPHGGVRTMRVMATIEIGLDTFGDRTLGPDGTLQSHAQVIRDLANRGKIGAERGWPPPTRAQFDREAGPQGALFVGSPETVAAKIAATARTLSLARFDLKYSNGPLPHAQLMRSIELIGPEVVPRVHALLAGDA